MYSAYTILIIAELLFAMLVFFMLFKISAPYGKFLRSGWGKTIRAKFGWMIMESPAVFLMIILFIHGKGWSDPARIVFLVLWQLHYLRRTFIYPFRINSSNKPFPVLLVVFAIFFNSINGFINGYEVFNANFYSMHWLQSPVFYTGLIIFLIGYRINFSSDKKLANLKSKTDNTYKIPRGGFFDQVSSPHYLGEIIEWTGWAILTWSISGLVFTLFTIANLAPRAYLTHRWYNQNFENYPSQRKALIPGLW